MINNPLNNQLNSENKIEVNVNLGGNNFTTIPEEDPKEVTQSYKF